MVTVRLKWSETLPRSIRPLHPDDLLGGGAGKTKHAPGIIGGGVAAIGADSEPLAWQGFTPDVCPDGLWLCFTAAYFDT